MTYVMIFSNDIVKVLAIDSFVPQFPVPSEEINTNHHVRKFSKFKRNSKEVNHNRKSHHVRRSNHVLTKVWPRGVSSISRILIESKKLEGDKEKGKDSEKARGICKINDEASASYRLVRRRLMRISRISDRLRVDRFCIVANSPTITVSINPFSRCATEWRRGNSGCWFPVSKWNSGDTSCWLRRASGRWFLFVEYLLVCLVFSSLRLFLADYEHIVSFVSYHFTRFYLALLVCKINLVIQFSLISTYTINLKIFILLFKRLCSIMSGGLGWISTTF